MWCLQGIREWHEFMASHRWQAQVGSVYISDEKGPAPGSALHGGALVKNIWRVVGISRYHLSFIIYHNHISFITAKHLIFQNDSYIWYINCILHVQHYTINVSPFMRTQFTTWETKPHPEVIDSHSHCPTTCVAAMVTVSLTRYRTPGKASPWWINQQSIVDRQKMPLFPKIRGPAHTHNKIICNHKGIWMDF